MSATDQVEALRARSRELLRQLGQRREEPERESDCGLGPKTDREETGMLPGESREEPSTDRVDTTTARFEDTCEKPTCDIADSVSTPPETDQHIKDSSHIITDDEKSSQVEDRLQDTAPDDSQSSQSCKEEMEEQSPVTCPSDPCGVPAHHGHHFRPLLGYDWIAGVLDGENDFMEQSDQFFNDLRVFRSTHKDECDHGPLEEISLENHVGSLKNAPKATHQCTFPYRINNRLFPVPLNHEECCSVCKRQKASHPHTTAEPALIRVTIPRSTLLPPHKYKAHRRCSFDSSDSLGLPSHCLLGQSHSAQSSLPPPRALDLQSNLNKKSQSSNLEDLILPKKLEQVSNISKLPRHIFQHFSPRKKLGTKPMY